MDTDRNLLFGVIAFQVDLLDAAQFAEGCNAWAARRNTALADVLVERGWLTAVDREHVEWLLERKLKKHGNDAGASFAAAVTPEAHRILALGDDPAIQSSLAKLSHEPLEETLTVQPVPPARRDRYTLTTLHAKGGIGQVWRAHDAQLGRDIALKELRPERARDARLQRYFVAEAQVTGQLEHPGIIPVYELAQPGNEGSPFYTMRFVEGRTFTAAIRANHDKRQTGAAGPLDFRGLVDAFVKVCQTLAYAHARGVIHRDLKGSNIVLGDFGEVIVLDWGFAKVLGQPEPERPSPPVVVAARDAADRTESGDVIGTPAYMAPEQAEGRLDQIDCRTDVYGLGAILYEILTGQPPFSGAFADEVMRRVCEEAPARPRSLDAGVPPALEAVCLKALAKQPAERYPSAADLAHEVQQWLADEPVTVYREPLSIRLGRWGRRHRTAVVSVGVGLAAAVLFLAVLAGVIEQGRRRSVAEQQRTEDARRKTRAALDDVGSEAIDTLLTQQKELTPEHKQLLRKMLAMYKEFAEDPGASPQTREEVADAHARMGRIRHRLGESEDAETAYGRARDLYARLAADFPSVPRYRLRLANSYNNLANLLQTKDGPEKTEPAYQASITILEQLATDFPKVPLYRLELARGHQNLAALLEATGQYEPAKKAYHAALQMKKQLADDFPEEPQYGQSLALSYSNLANLLVSKGELEEAEKAYHDAITIQKQLVGQFPQEPLYRKNLAQSQSSLGTVLEAKNDRHNEAKAAYEGAIAIQKDLVREFPALPEYREHLGATENNLAKLQGDRGQHRDAERTFQDALHIQQQLVAEFPTTSEYRNDLARTMINMARWLSANQQLVQARELLEKAEPHHRAALNGNAKNPSYQELFRMNRITLATTLAALGDHAAALQTAEQLSRLGWDPPAEAYDAACALALCIPLTGKKGNLSESQIKAQAQEYGDRAMAMLRLAVTKGYSDGNHMKEDQDLASLRKRDDFQKLLAELLRHHKGMPP
jgi:serine/threonine-protein kinase